MKRIGKFTGNIYDSKDFYNIKECGVCITEEQSNDEKFLNEMKEKNSAECKGCNGCPMSNM